MMARRAISGALAFVILLSAFALVSCGSPDAAGADSLSVVATTTIIADMARNVGGDRVTVRSLVPANADPHSFEPTPREIGAVARADVVLEHGMGLDAWVINMIDVSGTDAHVAVVTDRVTTIEGEQHEEDASGHSHEGEDPHVWFDVANAQVMVANIRDALIAADPGSAEIYRANATRYQSELADLDRWIREQIATIPESQRKLVTNHDAFGYYVHTYGLTLVGTIVPSLDAQAQPSARETAALIDLIRAEGVRAIFTEAALNPTLARRIAEDAGVQIVSNLYGDSLGPAGSGADTYIGMMRTDTTRIVEALR
ncbi:MAG TPA: zinc ABC transporter substrate-binding protein [Thermomicrobiales bacterium]|jgi:ABC-type Zn uptake system ZnuABC Zn-binding protein ZnuA|nr:zinc ABC transporter substrate-binding protein [Chloroflexota bacterium]HQX62129.1 zinc ABC transporter substrate-binding protein [Thermomicrobiales bacterium]HBY45284.1 zinc ABC transporter substrate-binding protein [Chloroflexota bacterium]HCG29164.1 zinc ABC transporter substrate-binding protein [Chloroflexota bacterium]HQZ89243.1 zinc ABC transporter substrate-binding protein [Thermomicrobiales bacterium]